MSDSNLIISSRSDLMTNYIASSAVSANKPISSVLDQQGNPVVFSIGTDNELWVAFQDESLGQSITDDSGTPSKTGWLQFDLSACLGETTKVLAFNTTQLDTGEFAIAIAVAAQADETSSSVYITPWLTNDMAETDWTCLLANGQWVKRSASIPIDPNNLENGSQSVDNATASQLRMGNCGGVDRPPLVLVTVTQGDDETLYYVNGDVNNSQWSWAVFSLLNNPDNILDIAFGVMNVNGAIYGTYVLYEIGIEKSLYFVSITSPVGSEDIPYSHALQVSPDARCLATLADPISGYSNLYVAGDSINYYDYSTQATKAVMGGGAYIEIVPDSALPYIEKLILAQDDQTVSIWTLDREQNLSYTFASQDSVVANDWATPLLLQNNVAHIAASRHPSNQYNQIITALSDQSLSYQWQDPDTSVWQSQDIPLQDIGSVQSFTSYTTTIHVEALDQNGFQNVLANQAVDISSYQWAYVTLNGFYYQIGPDLRATVNTDANGNVTIINKTATLSTPIYFVSKQDQTLHNINPAGTAIAKMAEVNTGQDLKDLFPDLNLSTDVANFGALSLQNITTAIASLPADGSAASEAINSGLADQSWGGSLASGAFVPISTPYPLVNAVEAVAGDVIRLLKTAVVDIGQFVFNVVEGAIHFAIEVAGEVFSFVIKAIGQALEILNWIIYELLGVDLAQIFQWLGFIFEWGDIVTTHKVFTNIAQQTMSMLQSNLDRLQDGVDNGLAKLLESIDSVGDYSLMDGDKSSLNENVRQYASTVQPSTTNGQDALNAALYGSGSNFAYYQTLHGGVMQGPIDDYGAGDSSIKSFISEVLLPTIKLINEQVSAASKQIIEDYNAGTLTLEEVIKLVSKTLIESVVDLLKALVDGLFLIAGTVLSSIESMLFGGIEIPFLTALYKLVTGGSEMSLVDGMSLLAAIPSTVFYKLAGDKAPFEEGTEGLDTANSMQEVLDILSGTSLSTPSSAKMASSESAQSSTTANEIATIYSQIGGATSTITSFVESFVTMAQALSEGELKFASKVSAATTIIDLAASIPIESDMTEESLDLAVYAGDVVSLLLDGILYLSSRDKSFEEEEIKGVYTLCLGVWDLVMNTLKFSYIISQKEPEGEDLAWQIETYIEDILSSISTVSSGVAEVAGDEGAEVELPAMVIAGGVQFLTAVLGLTRAVHTIQQDEVFHNN